MSALIVAGDVSGSVTLQAPSAAGSTVLTLPSTSGTLVTTASGNATSATNLADGVAGQLPYQSSPGTTAFVTNGTSGQFLQSNGSSAPSWVAAPSPAGGATVTSPMSSNVTLTSSSNKVQVLTPDAQSRRITLPDATTISAAGGPIFVLQNTVPWYPVAVMDSAGTNIGWVVADYESRVYLTSTASATGNWVIKTGNASADAGVYPYEVPLWVYQTTTLQGQDNSVALSPDLMIGCGVQSSSTYNINSLNTKPYQSGAAIGAVNNTNSTSANTYGYLSVAAISSSLLLTVYLDTTNSQLVCFATSYNSSGSPTKGTELNLLSVTNQYNPFFSVYAISSTTALVTYNNNSNQYYARVITISGTTCTSGTEVRVVAAAGDVGSRCAVLSSTLAHVVVGSNLYSLSISGTTLAVTSSVALGGNSYGVVANSATSSIAFYDNGSSQVVAKVATTSAGTVTVGTASSTLLTARANVSVNPVAAGTGLVTVVPSSGTGQPAQFALVKAVSGVPVAVYNGQMPGGTFSYYSYFTFSSGLGLVPAHKSCTNTYSYAYQKVAVTGGLV